MKKDNKEYVGQIWRWGAWRTVSRPISKQMAEDGARVAEAKGYRARVVLWTPLQAKRDAIMADKLRRGMGLPRTGKG